MVGLETRGKKDFLESERGPRSEVPKGRTPHRTRATAEELKAAKRPPKVSRMQSIKGLLFSGNYLARESGSYAKQYGQHESGGRNSTPVLNLPENKDPGAYTSGAGRSNRIMRAPKY